MGGGGVACLINTYQFFSSDMLLKLAFYATVMNAEIYVAQL